MKISVIIPTYKPQDYLWECLASLVAQTIDRSFFEVILVLNGCTDPWKNQIEDYIASNMQGMNVNFIHTLQGGVSNARNIALDQAKGEYITFIDDDDIVSPSFLESLYEKIDAETICLCYPFAFNDGCLTKQIYYPITDVYEEYHKKENICISSKVRKYFSGPCMKLIPMSFIQERRFDVRFANGEDSLFMFLISDKFKKFTFANRDAIYYRRYRKDSAVTRFRSRESRFKTCITMIGEYTKIFITGKYSFLFYLSRVLAEAKCIIIDLLGMRR